MASVKKQIEKAKKYYFEEWRGSEKICPAFGEKVFLTRLGWYHIAIHPRRLFVDKLIRLKNLGLARSVLEKSTTFQTQTRRGNIYYYCIRAIEGNKIVKVIVTSKGKKGKKLLYSVMFKSLKNRKRRGGKK